MAEKRKNKTNQRSRVFGLSFALVSFLAFSVFGSIDTPIRTGESLPAGVFHTTIQADNHPADFSHVPFHAPAEPGPASGKPQDKDKKDKVDENEWCKSHLFSTVSLNIACDSKSPGQRIEAFEHAFANRPQVALFVLHHCWKSFLS